MDHSEVVRCLDEGTILLGVDRAGARKFFTDLGLRQISHLTGEVPYIEWLVVRSSFLLAPLCVLGSLGCAVPAFHWYAILVGPLAVLLFAYWWCTSPLGNRRSGWSALLLAGAVSSVFTSAGPYIKLWLILTTAGLFLVRLTYSAAALLLRGFVIRNPRAYDLCAKHGVVIVQETNQGTLL